MQLYKSQIVSTLKVKKEKRKNKEKGRKKRAGEPLAYLVFDLSVCPALTVVVNPLPTSHKSSLYTEPVHLHSLAHLPSSPQSGLLLVSGIIREPKVNRKSSPPQSLTPRNGQ